MRCHNLHTLAAKYLVAGDLEMDRDGLVVVEVHQVAVDLEPVALDEQPPVTARTAGAVHLADERPSRAVR
jgi:hypothetical protein